MSRDSNRVVVGTSAKSFSHNGSIQMRICSFKTLSVTRSQVHVTEQIRPYIEFNTDLGDLAFLGLPLADSAHSAMCGYLPSPAPYYGASAGELLALPWVNYFARGGSEGQNDDAQFASRFTQIKKEITARENDDDELDLHAAPYMGVTFRSDHLTDSAELMVQGLAFEVLLNVDGYILRLLANRMNEAFHWLAAANAMFMEIMGVCRFLLPQETLPHYSLRWRTSPATNA